MEITILLAGMIIVGWFAISNLELIVEKFSKVIEFIMSKFGIKVDMVTTRLILAFVLLGLLFLTVVAAKIIMAISY